MNLKEAKAHIVVVDDEPPMRGLLKDFLESQGYQVTCRASAAAALKTLRDEPITDAIVSDIRMSPLTGMDLLRMVREHSPTLPVLLFTAGGSAEEREESFALGAAYYLCKPFSLTELKSSLEILLKKT